MVSLTPVLLLIGLLVANVIIFKDDATGGPNQLALLIAGLVTVGIGRFHLKVPYKAMEDQIVACIGLATQACLILLVVGSLIGLWILGGVVPTMIYFGLSIINPNFFLPVACLTCVLVSLSTGTSWGTTGTVGVALIGIGQTLGIPLGMVAGAVISGAYFGDKMSPLSDTTNLAPAMAGTDLFTHIRHMTYTSGPAIVLALLGFSVLSLSYQGNGATPEDIDITLGVLLSQFNISAALLIVPLAVIGLVVMRMPALPAIFLGAVFGAIAALIFQAELLGILAGGVMSADGIYRLLMEVAFGGYTSETGNVAMDSLLSRGGMASMLPTVWLILMAMVMGGALEATGMLAALAGSLLKVVSGAGSLIGATLASCILLNMTAADQYLAIVVPGRMFKQAYDDYGLHPKNLSRALEDSGTVTSVLVPWNSGGAYNSGVLGVATLSYLPFCFFNLLSPLVSLFLAVTNWTIERKVVEARGPTSLDTPA